MNGQRNLQKNLKVLRSLSDGPSTLSDGEQNSVKAIIREIGDRCFYNQGWYAASAGGEPEGKRSTAALNAEMLEFIRMLKPCTGPKRGRGRPPKTKSSYVDLMIGIKHAKLNPDKKSLDSHIERARQAGLLRKAGGHKRRIQRLMSDK
jgi:hypothetical protein